MLKQAPNSSKPRAMASFAAPSRSRIGRVSSGTASVQCWEETSSRVVFSEVERCKVVCQRGSVCGRDGCVADMLQKTEFTSGFASKKTKWP